MALQDHFRPPLSNRRHWHSFHNAWSAHLAEYLNQRLPEGYFAEINVQFGNAQFGIEIDVAAFSEVKIFSAQGGPSLVGAIELVSPANKDRSSHRNAFTSKCQTYLQQGIGVIIIDFVTTLTANLHNELMARLELQPEPLESSLYSVAYRVAETSGQAHLDFWQESLALGEGLPIVPLFLKGGLFLPMDLERSYSVTCDRLRIPS